MVYDSETFEALHPLTQEGRETHQKILEQRADEILFKHQHPLKWAVKRLKDMFSSES